MERKSVRIQRNTDDGTSEFVRVKKIGERVMLRIERYRPDRSGESWAFSRVLTPRQAVEVGHALQQMGDELEGS